MTFSRGYKNLMAKIQSDGIQKLAHNWMDDNLLGIEQDQNNMWRGSKIEVICYMNHASPILDTC